MTQDSVRTQPFKANGVEKTLPEALKTPIEVLLIDNFDSFTWNLYQSLVILGASVTVIRNDAIPESALPLLKIKSLLISPGPGHPQTDSGISRAAIKYFAGKVPVLGVCMGLECLVDVYGGKISYAGEIMHGKVSRIRHDGRGIFKGVPQGFKSTRYHSLSASVTELPEALQVTAATEESGVIMGIRHREYTVSSVQYHPESILSEKGDDILRNFLSFKGGRWDRNPESAVLDTQLPPFPLETLQVNGKAYETRSRESEIPTILERIYAQRLKDVDCAKSTVGTSSADLDSLLDLNLAPTLVSLVERLKSKTPSLMAEIKRASPSKGPIALTANAAHQALTYALAGASVISVLTEPTWFKGSLLDMRLARQIIDHLPYRPAILRKDFILDEYQIAEARLHGADTVLLIVAMLPTARLLALYEYSKSLGMEPLVEVNNAEEMSKALELGAKVIGVNNRNLHDFEVDMGTTSRLADMVRERDVVLCALSGISSPADVKTYTKHGVGAVLVGEALMRANDTSAFIRELLDWPAPPSQSFQRPLVKICGIRTEDEAISAQDAGADMIGLMFVPSSKRRISVVAAESISLAVRMSSTTRSFDPPVNSEESTNAKWFALHASRFKLNQRLPLVVGVFQNQPLSFVLETINAAHLDMVQLHGNEPVEWAKHIPVPVIRVFHLNADGSGLEGLTRPGFNNFALLDAARTDGLSGGAGVTCDWDLAAKAVEAGEIATFTVTEAPHREQSTKVGMPIILAGGLNPENVIEAIQKVRPWAVDVSGGVETDDGNGKDRDRIIAFMKAVHASNESVEVE